LMIDHGTRKGLRAYELFRAVMRLRALGGRWNSETVIKNHLSVERGQISTHFRATSLPRYCIEAYEAFLRDKATAPVKMTKENVDKLYTAWNDNLKAKPPLPGGGPDFKSKWDEVVESSKSGGRKDSTAALVKKVREGLVADGHPVLMNLFNYLMNEGTNGPSIDDTMRNLLAAVRSAFPDATEDVHYTEGGVTRAI
jgi:hypothetical protein